MRNLYKKYEEGGIGDPEKKEGFSLSDISNPLKDLVKRYGPGVIDAIEEIMYGDENAEAMDEFNRRADEMPTAREDGMRPDRRDMGAPREMRSLKARYVPGGSGYRPLVKVYDPTRQGQYNDTSGGRGLVGRTNPNVGEGIDPRRRLFRRR